MRKQLLLSAAAAFAVLAMSPGITHAQETDSDIDLTGDAYYLNLLAHLHGQAHLNASLTYLFGGVDLEGVINADSSAQAYVDTKQILTGNDVEFREEIRREGRSGGVNPSVWGLQVGTAAPGAPIEVGYFAPMVNTVAPFSISASGNVGLNIAAGWFNAQQNDAALATSGFSGDDDDSGGWSEASLLSLQLLSGNNYGSLYLPSDDDRLDDDFDFDDFRERNTVTVTSIAGDGNIGVNAAAGAFNIQQNALVMAVSDNSVLAKATAGVIQTADGNIVRPMDSVNIVTAGTISGSGNIGVNLASGVGNMQHNSLTMASSSAGTGGGGGGGGGNGGGS